MIKNSDIQTISLKSEINHSFEESLESIIQIYEILKIKKRIVLLGAPGSGKGTLSARILKALPHIVHISTGDLFRYNLSKNTPLGLKVKSFLDKGTLVPDNIVVSMIKERFNKKDVKENGFILDGFPRTLEQAIILSKIVKIDVFIQLDISKDVLRKRILGRYSCQRCSKLYNKYTLVPKIEGVCDQCGAEIKFISRSDDNEAVFQKRYTIYEKNSKPILEYYTKKSIIKTIDAEKTLLFTDDEIMEIIDLI